MQEVYHKLKKMMLQNGVTQKKITYLTYDDISFIYWLDNDNHDTKKYPNFNKEVIVIEEDPYYWLVYGGKMRETIKYLLKLKIMRGVCR